MWTAGPSTRHSAVTRDGGCAQDAAARYSAHHWTTIMTLEQRRNYGARENRAKGAVSIDGSASASRNAPGDTPKPCNAASNVDRVPDPGSRRTQSVSISLSGSSGSVADQACSVPT